MRVDLSCDTCGETYEPASVVRFSRELIWAAARSEGWVGSAVPGSALARHRCPSCAVEMVMPAVPTVVSALPGPTPVG